MQLGMGELGWTPETFWSATLPELLLALRGRRESEQNLYWHTGSIIAALRNVNGGKDGKAVQVTDVFPFLKTPGDPDPIDGEIVWQFDAYEEAEDED